MFDMFALLILIFAFFLLVYIAGAGSVEVATGLVAFIVLFVLGLLAFGLHPMRLLFLLIFLAGLAVFAFFHRLRDFEVPGVVYGGMTAGLFIAVVGLYFLLV